MGIASGISIPVAFGAGPISFFSPCVLPLVPSYISIISGTSYVKLRHMPEGGNPLKRTIALKSLLFILGFSVVFVTLSASFTVLGQVLSHDRMAMTKVGGALIVLFGLYTVEQLKLRPPMRDVHPLQFAEKPAGVLAPFLVGLSFGFAWTLCVGPTLGAIFTPAGGAESLSQGSTLLAIYALGLAVPFLISSLPFNAFITVFSRFNFFLPMLQKVGGLVLVAMGVLLFTGYLTVLNTYAISITPQWLWHWL